MALSKPAMWTLGLLLGLFLIVTVAIGNFNNLVTSRNQVNKAWASVETQYQRRFDLIGNLVGSVQGSQFQEQKVFGDIAKARSQYSNATNPSDKAAAASSVETNVALIPKLQEAYPELKSNENVQILMRELQGTEGGLLTARDNYNTVANNYNTNVERFPKNIYALVFHFNQFKLFKATQEAQSAPKVKFENPNVSPSAAPAPSPAK